MTGPAHLIAGFDEQLSLIDAGTRDGRPVRALWRQGAVRLLDSRLEEVGALPLELPTEPRLLAAEGLERLALTAGPNLLLLGEHRATIPGIDCDGAAFIGEHLLATAPADEGHRILLIDPGTGATLDEIGVDADDAGAFIMVHPHGAAALIEFAMGQDGAIALRIDVEDAKLGSNEILRGQDPVIGGFKPSGDRLLVVPYPSDPDSLRVLSWPALDELGSLTADHLGSEIGIGLPACWIDDDRVAAYAIEDSLVLADGRLRDPERIALPIDFGDDADLESLTRLRPGRVAAGVWTRGGRRTLVLDFSEGPAAEAQ